LPKNSPRTGTSDCAARRARPAQDREDVRQAADQFEKEYSIIADGQRSERWTEGPGPTRRPARIQRWTQ
jgi:hypothetical protein